MTIAEYIREREIRGMVTFTIDDIRKSLKLSDKSSITELQRQVAHGRVIIPYRGFYVIVPPQYALKGIIPPTYYIHELMNAVGKPYYVCLLSAAELHGAGHQRAMQTQVMTVAPRLKPSKKNALLDWNYRQNIPQELLLRKNTEMGIMLYSNAELTAIDLVQFASHVGGYGRAATVLAEMVENIEISKIKPILPHTTIATLQRLGFILEYVLEEQLKADDLFTLLKSSTTKWKSILLSNENTKDTDSASNRWHVNANIDIEIDEI